MRIFLFIRITTILIVISVLLTSCIGEKPGNEDTSIDMNLLLITIDTIRADRIGVYGHRVAEPVRNSLDGQRRTRTREVVERLEGRPRIAAVGAETAPLVAGIRPRPARDRAVAMLDIHPVEEQQVGRSCESMRTRHSCIHAQQSGRSAHYRSAGSG